MAAVASRSLSDDDLRLLAKAAAAGEDVSDILDTLDEDSQKRLDGIVGEMLGEAPPEPKGRIEQAAETVTDFIGEKAEQAGDFIKGAAGRATTRAISVGLASSALSSAIITARSI